MFNKIDKSKDGFLSMSEIKNGMEEILGTLKAQANDWKELM